MQVWDESCQLARGHVLRTHLQPARIGSRYSISTLPDTGGEDRIFSHQNCVQMLFGPTLNIVVSAADASIIAYSDIGGADHVFAHHTPYPQDPHALCQPCLRPRRRNHSAKLPPFLDPEQTPVQMVRSSRPLTSCLIVG